jgi:threonine dehydrogenase-like Zn-dependent dehydrogenase
MTDSIPRYGLSKVVSRVYDSVHWGTLGCLRYRDVAPPPMPNDAWLRVRTRYGGICGSDLGTITLHASTTTTVVTSFPFTLGHENVGFITELGSAAGGFKVGQRVVVNPLLPCEVRGFADLCPSCAAGEVNLCQRFDQGDIAPGLLTGFCRDTGGSWSSEFVAHRSQVLPVPSHLSDEEAVMAEPFAVALHAVLRNPPGEDDTVLIVGSGVIGLCLVAALRALGFRCRIVVTARYEFQAETAQALGADVVVGRSRGSALERHLTQILNARSLKPVLGPNFIVGGADIVYDCVGSAASIQDSLRFAASGGTVVIVGLAGSPSGLDWTPVWLNELTVRGVFAYASESVDGERVSTMALALRLMASGKASLAGLVTHHFSLDDYQHALSTVTSKGSAGVIKAVFAF